MSDLFLQKDAKDLLYNKFIIIIGDSIQRAIYKNLVSLIHGNYYLHDEELRAKGEHNFQGDCLVEGGVSTQLTNGITYREVREFVTDTHLLRFYFVTRCYNEYVESILESLQDQLVPDAVIMNSCLWDVTRYGDNSVDEYKHNLDTLFSRLKVMLPRNTVFIWNTSLPISHKARGGFLLPETEQLKGTLQLDIVEANKYVRSLFNNYSFDLLDLHFFMQHQLHRRVDDGVHWDMTAHRRITNLILTHLSEAWKIQLPQRI